MTRYFNLIGSEYKAPRNGKYFTKVNPADKSDIIGEFPDSTKEDVDEACERAKNAFESWSTMPPPKRAELIFNFAYILVQNEYELSRIIMREVAKTEVEALGDVKSAAEAASFMAGEGRRMYGQTTTSANVNRLAMTRRCPIGVCGLITAWNSPAAIIAWKLFPALICGNTVVIKPSEDAPLTANYIARVLEWSDFPPGVVNIVYGIGQASGEALVKNEHVKVVSFTGSSRVGALISQECGYRMKRCSLELGGKNGVIVMDDVDLSKAVVGVTKGAFSFAGQRCAATSRAFVHEKVYEKFMEMLVEQTKNMGMGMPDDPDTKVPPIINEKQYNSIVGYIERAEASGATIVKGKAHWVTPKGARFVSPAIITGVEWSSEVAREEIFGPVLVVFKVKSLTEAIDLLNKSDYGLTASIYTRNINDAMKAVDLINTGVCYINAPTFGSEPHMPFGGVKASGNGTREPGTQSLDVFSDWKTIYIDYKT